MGNNTPTEFTYESLKDGDKIQHEWFWNSNILSWESGIVSIWKDGQKVFFNDRHKNIGTTILPHRIQYFRPIPYNNVGE